jgi:hypothetical protein
VQVVWADITKAEGDVYATGHYIGVQPQRAERALDKAVSKWTGDKDKLIITDFCRRGVFRGAVGEIAFFPWDPGKLVAIVGMGRPGTFHRPQLKILARGLARSVGMLPNRSKLATVLIGSGDGNLTAADAVAGFIDGFVEAMIEDPSLKVDELRLVERELDRALEILQTLTELEQNGNLRTRVEGKLDLNVKKKLTEDPAGGGELCPEFGCSLLLGVLAAMNGQKSHLDIERKLNRLLSRYHPKLSSLIKRKFDQLSRQVNDPGLDDVDRVKQLAMALRLRDRISEAVEGIPSRLSFWTNKSDILASAITNKVTVTERQISDRLPLIEREIELLVDPPPDQFEADGASDLQRLLVPSDFREVLGKADSLVLEVDRTMARVQWEMLPTQPGAGPLGVTVKIGRQLRTAYSPRPDDIRIGQELNVLIIGDPDNSLPDARDEAKAVDKLLKSRLRPEAVLTLIGAPEEGTRGGTEDGFGSADYFQVVKLLLRGRFDIVHYCGHAQFDKEDLEHAGWAFKHGRLSANELEGMERPPILVVANACLTAQVSQTTIADNSAAKPPQNISPRRPGEVCLVATLADEFFRRGITHYIGTAWEVPSLPAQQFAEKFYERLLDGKTVGEAVLEARKLLYQPPTPYPKEGRMAWAAYQHYGDPSGSVEFGTVRDLKKQGTPP